MGVVRSCAAVLVAGLFVLVAGQGHAQEQDLAVLYQFEPRTAAIAEMEQAIAEHARWRAAEGDPWIWDVYQVVTGDNLGTYFARSPSRAWADLDSYDAGFGPRGGAHFNETVAPHLRSNSSMITRLRADEARLPEEPGEMRLFSVAMYQIKAGQMSEFWEVVGQFHQAIEQADVPVYYSFHSVVAGGTGPEIHLVTLHRNWADFEQPDPTVMQALQQAYGEEGAAELGQRFSDTIESGKHMVLRLRPDLSVGR